MKSKVKQSQTKLLENMLRPISHYLHDSSS